MIDIPSVNQKHVAKILFVERLKLNMRLTKDIVSSYIGQILNSRLKFLLSGIVYYNEIIMV